MKSSPSESVLQSNKEPSHVPVLLWEVIGALDVKPGKWYLDATFGRGGHTGEILKAGGNVVAFDVDQEAFDFATTVFSKELTDGRLIFFQSNFDNLIEIAKKFGEIKISGILADFGMSSDQIENDERGFSFSREAQLDMRMDPTLSVTAKDLVNGMTKPELIRMLRDFAQERRAKKIAEAIDRARRSSPIQTTTQLARVIAESVPREGGIHQATKTFMALRMLVNDELGVIERMLPQALDVLERDGKLVMISFHQGEDRIVKHFFRSSEEQGLGEVMTKKPIMASNQEISENPRSRSAKLRIFRKSI